MDSKSENRRNVTRKIAITYFEVRDNTSGEALGQLIDLNLGGLRLLSPTQIEVGKFYHLRINLPEPIMNQTQIIFGGLSKWCRETDDAGQYYTGFELRNLSQIDYELIEKIIRSPKFEQTKFEYSVYK